MRAPELRRKYLDFFRSKGHAEIGSASLVPENDPTVLFTTAGMHPLVPFLLGEKHPAGRRLVNCQKCIRTGDIEEVGDAFHLTFFEMLGNWSLGDYFKADTIRWSWEFLTSAAWLGLDPARLAVTCFAGDDDAPRDDEAAGIWRACGMPAERIYFLGKRHNWWGPAGQTGPCGPDTEMFWITDVPACSAECSPACSCGHYVEIWNDVFMQYEKRADGTFVPLAQKNVDTGMGLARTAAVLQGLSSAYETELYAPTMAHVARLATATLDQRAQRIVTDHATAAVFIIQDGVDPSNLGRGYVLRRIIRRAVRMGRKLGIEGAFLADLASTVIGIYGDAYPELVRGRERIHTVMSEEEAAFARTLVNGLKEFEKIAAGIERGKAHGGGQRVPGKKAFMLYDTYGFPPELTQELCAERGYEWDAEGYSKAEAEHVEKSREGAGTFKGGLADHSEATTKLHTATHLLHQALRKVLGDHVFQRGSNITPERLRFDFSHADKLTPEQLAQVEALVQAAIDRDLQVSWVELDIEEARTTGAIGIFDERYGQRVKVYTMGDFSREICGGPHVEHTGVLGRFRIQKEEPCAKGIRRIRAVLEEPGAGDRAAASAGRIGAS